MIQIEILCSLKKKKCFAFCLILIISSTKKFAHVMTDQLWRVQIYDLI